MGECILKGEEQWGQKEEANIQPHILEKSNICFAIYVLFIVLYFKTFSTLI